MNKEVDSAPLAYSGDRGYVFVSYSHKDANLVYRDLNALQVRGLNFWYDEGIHVGDEWDEKVKSKIDSPQCRFVIFYVSKRSVLSESIEQEIRYVFNVVKKPFLHILIGDDSLKGILSSSIMDMPMERIALYTSVFADNRIFLKYGDNGHISSILDALVSKDVIDEGVEQTIVARRYVQKTLFIGKKSNFSLSLVNGMKSFFSENQDITLDAIFLSDFSRAEEEIISIIDRRKESCSVFFIRPIAEPSPCLQKFVHEIMRMGKFVIFLDLDFPETDYTKSMGTLPYYVGSDFDAGGRKIAEKIAYWVGSWGKEKSCVVVFSGPDYKRSVRQRCGAIVRQINDDGLAGITGEFNLQSLNVENESRGIINYFRRLHEDGKLCGKSLVLFCGNDTIADFIMREYLNLGSEIRTVFSELKHIVFVGYDGIKDIDGQYMLQKYPCSSYTVDVDSQRQGIIAAELAHKLVFGTLVDRRIMLVEPFIVKKIMIQPRKVNNIKRIDALLDSKKFFIFDLDGTIADTERLHWKAYNILLADYGVTLNDSNIAQYIGNPEILIYDMIRKDYGIEFDSEDFLSRRIGIYLKLVEDEHLMPFQYVYDVMERYPNVKMGLLTSQIPSVVYKLMTLWGLDGRFPADLRISVHDGKLTKGEVLSDPELYYGADKSDCLVFEDSEHTLKLASEKGYSCVGVTHKFNEGKLYHCDAIIDNNIWGVFVGLCCQDISYIVDAMPRADQKVKTENYRMSLGGPATNAAITYALMGGKAMLVTCLGKSQVATEMKASLDRLGVTVYDIAEDDMEYPNIASIFISKDDGSRSVVSGQLHCGYCDGLTSEDIRHICDTANFCLCDCNLKDGVWELIDGLRKSGIPIVLDIGNWKPQMKDYLRCCSDVIASENLLGRYESLHKLEDEYPNIADIAVTRGRKNIMFQTSEEQGELPVRENHDAVDTNGAGDILHGAYCYFRYNKGFSFKEALEHAALEASFCVGFEGVIPSVSRWIKASTQLL